MNYIYDECSFTTVAPTQCEKGEEQKGKIVPQYLSDHKRNMVYPGNLKLNILKANLKHLGQTQ